MKEELPQNSPIMTITKIETGIHNETKFNAFNYSDLPVLPTRNLILFPEVTAPIGMARESSRLLAEEAARRNIPIAVICQKDASVEYPTLNDLDKYGVLARVINVFTLPNGAHTAIFQAIEKFRVVGEGKEKGQNSLSSLSVSVRPIKDRKPKKDDKEFEAMVSGIKQTTLRIIDKLQDPVGLELGMNLNNLIEPEMIINTVASLFPIDHDVKLHLLSLHRLKDRAFELLGELTRQEQMAQLTEEIRNKARKGMEEQQKNAFLHEQMDAIREELYGEESDDLERLQAAADKKNFSKETRETVNKEISKLGRLNPQSPDYSVQYNFLDLVLSLPWGEYKAIENDFSKASDELESAHYGLEKVKDRILEQFAVIMNNPDVKSPIICLVGPPGVGKTSIAKSVAAALGRDYQRISLGGVHDEAEIRGHRRTYIGAMPGRIIDAMKRVKSANPVLVLDEIDKLGKDYKGDPSSALLEVLDPEQNSHFHDNYVDMDFDLSKVLFIATANTLTPLSQPLIDRMEVIELSGYAEEEKIEIAKRHLIEKVKAELGYSSAPELTDDALKTIIEEYTSESGVRQLEKKIASIFRKTLKIQLKEGKSLRRIDSKEVRELLGVPTSNREKYDNNDIPGVVTGLAWTAVGGEILFIESSLIPGKGEKLSVTGNLGDVMKESATLAYQYVKSNAEKLGISTDKLSGYDIHIHVPEGAVPKDGPSAGITLVTALVSLLRNVKVKDRIAMTGEITLRGKVMPVGGIKEKVLAAKRAGIKEIILCKENQKDIQDIPKNYLKGLKFHYVNDIMEVLDKALMKEKS